MSLESALTLIMSTNLCIWVSLLFHAEGVGFLGVLNIKTRTVCHLRLAVVSNKNEVLVFYGDQKIQFPSKTHTQVKMLRLHKNRFKEETQTDTYRVTLLQLHLVQMERWSYPKYLDTPLKFHNKRKMLCHTNTIIMQSPGGNNVNVKDWLLPHYFVVSALSIPTLVDDLLLPIL